MKSSHPTNVDQLRSRIDAGDTGDKIASSDPAAVPLGVNAEARGSPPRPTPSTSLGELVETFYNGGRTAEPIVLPRRLHRTATEEFIVGNAATTRGRNQDRARVAGGQNHEVKDEARKTGASKVEVEKTVKTVGISQTKVEKRVDK